MKRSLRHLGNSKLIKSRGNRRSNTRLISKLICGNRREIYGKLKRPEFRKKSKKLIKKPRIS
jgi:hypothetical protein